MSSYNSNANCKLTTVSRLLAKIERTDGRSLAWPTAHGLGANNRGCQSLDLYQNVPLLYSDIDVFKETISENERNKGEFFNALNKCKVLGHSIDDRFRCSTSHNMNKPKKKKVSSEANSLTFKYGQLTLSKQFPYIVSDEFNRNSRVPEVKIIQFYKTPVYQKRYEIKNNAIPLNTIKWLMKSINLMIKTQSPKKKQQLEEYSMDRRQNIMEIIKNTQKKKRPLHKKKKNRLIDDIDEYRKITDTDELYKNMNQVPFRKIYSVPMKKEKVDIVKDTDVKKKVPEGKEPKTKFGDAYFGNIFHILKKTNRDSKKNKIDLKKTIPETKEVAEKSGDPHFRKVYHVPKKKKEKRIVPVIDLMKKLQKTKEVKKKKMDDVNFRKNFDVSKKMKNRKFHHMPKTRKDDKKIENIDIKNQRKERKPKFREIKFKKIHHLTKKSKGDNMIAPIRVTSRITQRMKKNKKFPDVKFKEIDDFDTTKENFDAFDEGSLMGSAEWDQPDRPFKKYRSSSKMEILESRRKRLQRREWQRMFSSESLDVLEDFESTSEFVISRQSKKGTIIPQVNTGLSRKSRIGESASMISKSNLKEKTSTNQSTTTLSEATSQKKEKKITRRKGSIEVLENTKVVNYVNEVDRPAPDIEDTLSLIISSKSNLNKYRELGHVKALAKKKRPTNDILNSVQEPKLDRVSLKTTKMRRSDSKKHTYFHRHSSDHMVNTNMKNWWLHTQYQTALRKEVESEVVDTADNYSIDLLLSTLPESEITYRKHFYQEPEHPVNKLSLKPIRRSRLVLRDFTENVSHQPEIQFIKPIRPTKTKPKQIQKSKPSGNSESGTSMSNKKSFESIHVDTKKDIATQKEEVLSEKILFWDANAPPFLYYPYDNIYPKDPEPPAEVNPIPKRKRVVKRKVKKVLPEVPVQQMKTCCCICTRLNRYRANSDDPFIVKLKRQMKRQELKVILRSMQRIEPVDETTHETKLKFQCTDDIAPCCQIVPSTYRTPRH